MCNVQQMLLKTHHLLLKYAKKTEIRALALACIKQLENKANNCCVAGGLWKGCLQSLVNKLH
jgi:hypothetical protein